MGSGDRLNAVPVDARIQPTIITQESGLAAEEVDLPPEGVIYPGTPDLEKHVIILGNNPLTGKPYPETIRVKPQRTLYPVPKWD